MNDDLIKQKSWWIQNWKWLIPAFVIVPFIIVIFFSSGLDRITSDLTKAYTDTELYENALEQVKADARVVEIIGEIKSIDKFAILEGAVKYSSDNKL